MSGLPEHKVSGARKVPPANATPAVGELPSNPAIIVTPVNPETAGTDLTPVWCGSTAHAAKNFNPKKGYHIHTLDNLAGNQVKENESIITMEYGREPEQIMDDFKAENIVVKAYDSDGNKPLLEQRITLFTLDSLLRLCDKQEFKKTFESSKKELLCTLEGEIKRTEELLDDTKIEQLS